MPHQRSGDVEEERRLLYVALTRSKGAADLTFVRFRFGRTQVPSPFLSEIAEVRGGAAVWVGGDAPERPEKAIAGPAAATRQILGGGTGPKVYRRRGGRSLIPPGGE